uniref:N-lysine methyltransferase setd6 n=1 Tax=Callorhinchus milii TaxID=7868 RepID=V9KDG5_CALMI
MAAPSKRLKMGCEHTDADTDSALSCFLQWCKRVGLELSRKVCVSAEGTVAQYGMLATQHIQEGELLFSVPRSALLNPRTSAIRDLLKKEEAALQSRSGWVPLLIALLHESTSSSSHWQPYLSLWPGFSSLNHPMFWEEGERARLLQGTGVLEAVQRDLRNIEDEHQSIVLPFLRAHPQTFPPNTHCLQLYKRLVAFVMAYSFQEPSDNDEEDDDDEDEDDEQVLMWHADAKPGTLV